VPAAVKRRWWKEALALRARFQRPTALLFWKPHALPRRPAGDDHRNARLARRSGSPVILSISTTRARPELFMTDDPEDPEETEPSPLPPPARLTVRETAVAYEILDGEAVLAVVPLSVPDARRRAHLFAAAPTLLWATQVAEIFMNSATPPRAKNTAFAEKAFGALHFAAALARGDVT